MEKIRLGQQEWTLGSEIGKGTWGVVYEARSDDGQTVAIKLLPKNEYTEREPGMHVAATGMPNVIPVLAHGEHNEQLAIVMPRAVKSLRDHLKDAGGMLSVQEAISILKDIAVAVAAMGEESLLHRDLKPGNVLLLDGWWQVTDLGMAREADAETVTFTFKYLGGTPAYNAPERWRGEHVSIAADVYSLGVIAFEILAGAKPFPGPSDAEFREQHLNAPVPALPEAVPDQLAALIQRSLYKADGARPRPGAWVSSLDTLAPAPLAGGLAALAEANRNHATLVGEADRNASARRSEAEKREELFNAAKDVFGMISRTVLDAIGGYASAGDVRPGEAGGWTVHLGQAFLYMSGPSLADIDLWRDPEDTPPPFDVVAYAVIRVYMPANTDGYTGRKHSLWYGNIGGDGLYDWYEIAFWDDAAASDAEVMPLAVDPDVEGRRAVGDGVATDAPFVRLDPSDLGDFISRWANFLAQAYGGTLARPNTPSGIASQATAVVSPGRRYDSLPTRPLLDDEADSSGYGPRPSDAWVIRAPDLPLRPAGGYDETVDFILRSAISFPTSPEAKERPVSDDDVEALARALNSSPLSGVLLRLSMAGTSSGGSNPFALSGFNRARTVRMRWTGNPDYWEPDIPPRVEAIATLEVPGAYGSPDHDLMFTVDVIVRNSAVAEIIRRERGTDAEVEPSRVSAWDLGRIIDGLIATLSTVPVASVLAAIAGVDEAAVPQPRVLHMKTTRETTKVLYMDGLRLIDDAGPSMGSHVLATPARNLGVADERHSQVKEWLIEIAKDSGLVGMQKLTEQIDFSKP